MIKSLRNIMKQDKAKFKIPRGVQDVIPIKSFEYRIIDGAGHSLREII